MIYLTASNQGTIKWAWLIFLIDIYNFITVEIENKLILIRWLRYSGLEMINYGNIAIQMSRRNLDK